MTRLALTLILAVAAAAVLQPRAAPTRLQRTPSSARRTQRRAATLWVKSYPARATAARRGATTEQPRRSP